MRWRIGEVREDQDIKQCVVAKRLSVSPATLSRYESRQIEIPVRKLIMLAKYYNVSVDYLVGLSDEMRCLTDKKPCSKTIPIKKDTREDYQMGA